MNAGAAVLFLLAGPTLRIPLCHHHGAPLTHAGLRMCLSIINLPYGRTVLENFVRSPKNQSGWFSCFGTCYAVGCHMTKTFFFGFQLKDKKKKKKLTHKFFLL